MIKLLNLSSKIMLLIAILLVFGVASFCIFKIYDHFRYHIFVKFKESGPLFKGMPVCFKGYKIGETQSVTLSKDYKYTYLKIVLYPKEPKLPKDIEAVVRKHDVLRNYIDLVNSEEPSSVLLKSGEVIEGNPLFDMGTFLAEIQDADLLIPLIQNFSDAALSLNKTSSEIGSFFSDSRSVLKDNKKNLNNTTKSLENITTKLDKSITEDKLENTTSSVNQSATNIKAATESIKNITQSVDCATRNLDKTIAKIDSTILEANCAAKNARVITGGFCEVMGKRLAGLRIIFGKPLGKNKCKNNCSK